MRNPLRDWLEANGLKPNHFAKRAELGTWTAYRLASDDRAENFDVKTLRKVEVATNGAVTLRMMIEWLDPPRTGAPHGPSQERHNRTG